MRFIRDEASEFDHAWGGTENAIRPDRVVDELLRNAHTLVRLGLGNEAP